MASQVGNFRFNDIGQAFDAGYARVNALQRDRARVAAGNALRTSDYGGAAGALYDVGDLEGGARIASTGVRAQEDARKSEAAKKDALLKYTGDMAGRLSAIVERNKDPSAAVSAFDTYFAPGLAEYGETPDEIAQLRQQLAANPQDALLAWGGAAAKELGHEVRVVGDEALVFEGGKLIGRYRGAKTASVAEGGALYEIPGSGGVPADVGQDALPSASAAAPPPQAGAPDPLFEGLVQQESGGRAGVLGPQTQYGRAEGRTQMLPATAEAMARKLNVPWRPDLMRGDTPAAAAYQDKLGRAYLDEGLEKYGGDPRKALMYYHGGPDESLWGPKTNAYADSIMSKVGPQLAGGAGNDQLAQADTSGPRLLVSRPKAPNPKEALEVENLRSQIAARTAETGEKQAKVAAADDARARGVRDQVYKAQDLIERAKQAREAVNGITAGMIGGNMDTIAGTPAYNLARQIDTIKANLGFAELAAMRASSPTGGALGAVSERELRALESTVASLDSGQSPAQLRASLDKVVQHYQRWLDAVEGQGAMANPSAPAAPAPGQPRRLRFDAQGNIIR